MRWHKRLELIIGVQIFVFSFSQASCTKDTSAFIADESSPRFLEATKQTDSDMSVLQTPNITEEPHLFIDTTKRGELDTTADPTIIRTRYVEINFEILEGAEVDDEIILNLFEDVVFTALLDRKESAGPDRCSWIGHLEGIEHSQIIMVISDRQVAGNITLPDFFYQIRFAGNGVHAIHMIDQSAFPPEDEPTSSNE